MKTILLVDDKEDNLYLLETVLTNNGYNVVTAAHGAEALIKARKSPPDIIVSDLLMPVMDGYTLLRRWRHDPELCNIPFVVYTATYTDANDRKLAIELGADEFILKPTETEDLLMRLRDVERSFDRTMDRKAAPSVDDDVASAGDSTHLKLYNESLVRKLEAKSLELQQANEALRQDLETRKEMEASLVDSEQRFRQLAENIEEVFWITDPEKKTMQYVSPAYETIWGRSSSSLYEDPSTWMAAIHPDDRERIRQAAVDDQITGAYDAVYRIIRPDGEERWIHDRGFPVTDDAGNVCRIVGTASDITRQKIADNRIAEQAALLDKAHDAIVVRDLEHRVQYWNRSAEALYGWTAEEAMGRKVTELAYDDLDRYWEAMDATLDDGEWMGELEQRCQDGRLIIAATRWTLVRNASGEPTSILVINTDVTEKKRLEKQLLQAQRMESIGTLAGGIAHDLNNLLAPIVMGVDLLKHGGLDQQFHAILESMSKSAHRGTNLVKQVLSFARGMDGERSVLSLKHIVQEVEALVKTSFPKNIQFKRETDGDLWPIKGDPTQLHQVILNLCVNARDAMPGGGELIVRTRNMHIDAQYASMNPTMKEGRYAVLEVADTGSGMSAEVRGRVFEPFFTTKDSGEGTGLGLPTVRSIVQGHGGEVTVYSEEGRGSVFKIYIPAVEDVETYEDALSIPTDALLRGSGECILVVDDESAILEITRQTLETFGYTVLVAEDGAQAIGMFADHQDDVRLVLTDMMMPVMDGAALIAALRRMAPSLPIIAASGIHTNGDTDIGANKFLEKPYSAAALLEAVAELVG